MPTKVPVDWLRFDMENPRYSEDRGTEIRNDEDIIRYLVERADLFELIESIAHSGYIDIEPLIVLRWADHLTVLEGNRRLAAIRLLREPSLAEACKVTLPPLADDTPETLEEVTVYAVAERSDARDFIGFKHINGPHRWDSIAKARFAARWYERERDAGMTLFDIARRMGDRHDTIKRMVAGIFALDQAKREGLFSVEGRYSGRPFAFSHLYTALTRPGYRQYLGLPEEWRSTDPEPDPVPKDKLDNLSHLMLWLYGSAEDDIRPIVTTQNPHVKQLGGVLAKPKALAILLSTRDLKAAYAEIDTPATQFEAALVNAHQHAQGALSKISGFKGEDGTLVEIARELARSADILEHNMVSTYEKFLKSRIADASDLNELPET